MLSARGHNETTGRTLYLLALAPEDLVRLQAGLPLHVDGASLGLYAEVLVVAGAMAAEIQALLEDEA